jgi:uncharacterized protein (DUF305 family)
MRFIAALALLVALSACNTAAPTANPSPADGYNSTDVMFAQMMLNHQPPAEKMLLLAEKRATDEKLKTLAAAIRVTQADEAKMVQTWLLAWKAPTNVDIHAENHGAHGGLPSNGEAELESLTKASDAEFERTFLNIFIGYQHQAVEYAKFEIGTGANRDAVAYAKRVDSSRRGQIEMMLKML